MLSRVGIQVGSEHAMIKCADGHSAAWLKGLRNLLWVAGITAGSFGCGTLPLERSPNLGTQCRRDLQQASRLRGLQLKRDVAIERESPEMLAKSLATELDKAENRAFIANTSVLLSQLRAIKKDDDLKSIFLKVMSQQVAAYYDPEKKRVAYVEGATKYPTNSPALPLMDRFVYVHEFCHAVEDSQFDIDRLSRESLSDFDRNQAMTSLIEGDAMLVGLDSIFAEAPVNTATPLGAFAVQMMGSLDLSGELKAMGDCPPFLGGALIRPYLDGGIFSNRFRREAGWQAVDNVFRGHLPLTTAEILYPERRFLRNFKPAVFRPDKRLFDVAQCGVLTNRVGAMGMAMWLGGNKLVRPRQDYGFLKGWAGDQIYFLKSAESEVACTVWISCWEREGYGRSFCRQVERKLSASFSDVSWRVGRSGPLVAVVWSDKQSREECERLVKLALATEVDAGVPSPGFVSWCEDLPWPVRFRSFEDYSCGLEVLGGHVVDITGGDRFSRFNLADGLVLRAETNPDRRYWGILGGLVRYVRDERSDFTYWTLPVLASWFRRCSGDGEQFKWSVLWGFAGYGNERKAKVLSIPVWRSASQMTVK